MGLSIWEVGKLNPHKMRILERNYLENERKKDEEMWLLGRYFMHSISAALNSDVQYFEKPLFADKYDEMLLTPEELEKKRIDEMLRAEENWQNVGRESGLDDIWWKKANVMNKINWKVRIKNKAFWLAIIPAVIVLIQVVARVFGYEIDLGELGNNLKEVVNAVFMILAIIGVVNDPTTATLNDSKRVMDYEEPRKESVGE